MWISLGADTKLRSKRTDVEAVFKLGSKATGLAMTVDLKVGEGPKNVTEPRVKELREGEVSG